MGIFDGKTTCGRCTKEIGSHDPAATYRDGTFAHIECAPPRGTRQRWSEVKRRFMSASERQPVWTLLLALHRPDNGVSISPYLLVEEEPFRVSVNGSSPVLIGALYWSAVQELEELGFVMASPEGTYALTMEGKTAVEMGPPKEDLTKHVPRGTTPEG